MADAGQLGGSAGPRKRKVFDVKACFEAGRETSQGVGRRHLIWLPSFRSPSRKKAGARTFLIPTPCAFQPHPPSRGLPFRTPSLTPGFLTTRPILCSDSSTRSPPRRPPPDRDVVKGEPHPPLSHQGGGGSTSGKKGEETVGPEGLSLGDTLDIT